MRRTSNDTAPNTPAPTAGQLPLDIGLTDVQRKCSKNIGVRGSPYGPTLRHSSIRFNTIIIRSNHPITTLRYSLCPWHLPNSFYLQIVPDRRAYLQVRAWPYG